MRMLRTENYRGPGWGDDRAHCQLLISAFSEPVNSMEMSNMPP